ncbi:MAG TPA: HD domain-containing phosphohydrolase [Candidatus Limnocylindria bacterium]|nr:HD domain-containing phosphohydrolase [Candidatus Limnocylindria bacterium]
MKNNDVASVALPGAAKKATSIVVIEDDPASADVLQRRLQANGMKVAVGKDGGEGLALVREVLPDLVLLDVMLPDTDGYDVCVRIKSDGSIAHIPVVFLSARGEAVDKVRGLSCGAADYVTKPWNAAELLARIDAVLLQARNARPPRLEPQLVRPPRSRPLASVALEGGARRATAEELLAPRFDIANDGADAVDLVLIDAGATPDAGLVDEGTVVLVVARGSETPATEFARLDGDLTRHAARLVREMSLARDMGAAAEALITLATSLEAHDRFMMGHGERVAARAVSIAELLGLGRVAIETIRLGALLRDVGNAKLPPPVGHTPGELTAHEREAVELHPLLGEELLRHVSALAPILPIVRWHHERLDGGGYPDHLRAEKIPLEVRIVSVADRFEALLVERPDRAAVSEQEAVRIVQGAVARGELDPAVVAALVARVRSVPTQEVEA